MIIIMGCVCFDEECASVLLLVMNRLPLSPFLSLSHTHTHTRTCIVILLVKMLRFITSTWRKGNL